MSAEVTCADPFTTSAAVPVGAPPAVAATIEAVRFCASEAFKHVVIDVTAHVPPGGERSTKAKLELVALSGGELCVEPHCPPESESTTTAPRAAGRTHRRSASASRLHAI
jgi:hypothetical protein